MLLSAAIWMGSPSPSRGAESEIEYNRHYRSNYEVPHGSHYTGRSPFMRQRERAPAPEAPPPRRVQPPPAPDRESCTDPISGLVNMGIKMPPEVTLGQEFMYELDLRAVDCVGNVVVTDRVPEGATYVRSEPAAEVQGDLLVWRLNEMQPGQAQNIKVWVKADREGRLVSCATISADPRVCAETRVGRPALAITKTGAEQVQVGNEIAYNIVVSNTGTAVAQGVTVKDTIPEGLSHSSGQRELNFQVGDLAPNQSKTIPVVLRADQRGKFCNTAVAASTNAGEVSAEACTSVVQPGLKIVKTGDQEQLVSKRANYTITVSNTGDIPLNNVVVTDSAPAETTILQADGGTVSGNTITWNAGTMAPGTEKTFNVVLTTPSSGNFCNNVSVVTAEGLRESAQACTVWKGVSALLLEKGDNPDPIQVGETTTYFVRVTNQGNADDTNVRVTVEFPQELTPVSADNGGQVSGQTVTFPPYPRLTPKQAFEYHIVVRGATPGDARVRFIRTSDDIPAPTTAEESTRVY